MPSKPELTLVPPAIDDPSLYINRELSWLEFNRRVLEEAQDPGVPLLERLKFLAIFSSNLDEFFMVRVGGLQQKVISGVARGSGADRMPPNEQIERISQMVRPMVAEQNRLVKDVVLPDLEKEGIIIRRRKDLSEAERRYIRELFRKEIYPVLTPLAIDPGHPFPHLSNKTLNVAVLLRRPKTDEELVAFVQVPSVLSRFIPLPLEGAKEATPRPVFVPLETVIRLHLDELFPGMVLQNDVVFRVTRDSEYEIDDEEVEDLLKAIEEEVKKRKRGAAVRLDIEAGGPPEIEQFLMSMLDLDAIDVYATPGLLDVSGLIQLHTIPGFPHLRDPQFTPQPVPEFTQAANVWAAIRQRDILVHHPYESFNPVVDFIETAATDDRVLAIKQTLYRTSSDSTIVRALQRAADAGKQVTAVIELKARLDEERNIQWARELEKVGVHVVFGFIGLKTHCKVALVVRREDDGIRRYVHLGTGNYNPQTARTYTDLGFFTCDPVICEDATVLFNYLTGYGELPEWRKLIIAPSRMQTFMLEKIDQEIRHQEAKREGKIIAKINGLLEPAIVQALYRASQAGVKIDINCRGICGLRPGIPGVSDNIRVTSIVDRFLEHSRIYYFGNAGKPEVYIGSADWMDRNLSRRVESIWPIEQPDLKVRLIEEILATTLSDNVKSRELQPDGSYRRVVPAPGEEPIRSQQRFLELAAMNAARRQWSAEPPRPATPRINRRPKKRRQTG